MVPTTQWRKEGLPNIQHSKNEIGLSSHTNINSKLIKDLNVPPETLKLLEENIGGNLLDLSLGNDFLDMKEKAKARK